MTTTTISTSDHDEFPISEGSIYTTDVPDVHVSLAGEARCNGDEYDGARTRCAACHERLNEDGHALDGDEHCPEYVPDEVEVPEDFPVQLTDGTGPHDATDGACGLSWDDSLSTSYTPAPAGRCPFEAFHVDDEGPHDPTPIPLSWANSASIRADEDEDRIMVTISVGDPRGAFAMYVTRVNYTDLDTGEVRDELRLSVPTPGDSFPHMDLTPLASPGYFRVGQ